MQVLGPGELERAREGVPEAVEPSLSVTLVLEHRHGNREPRNGEPGDGDDEEKELAQRKREGDRNDQGEDREQGKPNGYLGPRFAEPVSADDSRGRRVGRGEDEREDEDVDELWRRRRHEQRAADEGAEAEGGPDPVAVEANRLG
jgi:hypothetical protein